jgi:hypothetical protein
MSGCNIANDQITQQTRQVKVDKNYLLALNTADKFLIAWLNRDYKNGTELLTEKVKNSLKQEDLMMFFTGVSNPHHQGFEIMGKEYVDENTFRFEVWLYEYYTGETPRPTERPDSYSFDVIKVNENTWLVNNLPEKDDK